MKEGQLWWLLTRIERTQFARLEVQIETSNAYAR
jgi:hypothetical protein